MYETYRKLRNSLGYKDSDVAKQLTSDDFALMDGDKMSGIAYVIESYGIIYNKELLKKAGYSADDITNFDSFKKVVLSIYIRWYGRII